MLPVWLDGEVLPAEAARVSVADRGLTVGDGVFETLRTAPDPGDGTWRPFAVTRHLRRLRASLAAVGLDPGRDDDELAAALDAVAAGLAGPGRVRLTVTAGTGAAGTGRDGGRPTVLATAQPFDGWPPTGTATLVRWRRNPRSALAGVKSTSYGENVVALAEARRRGFDEALLATTDGRLCEGTGTNVFVVADGVVATPTLGSGCLPGVTRELVCELAEVAQVDLRPQVLAEADEVFLTSTTRDVQGLHRIGARALPAPGPVTTRIASALADLVARDLDP